MTESPRDSHAWSALTIPLQTATDTWAIRQPHDLRHVGLGTTWALQHLESLLVGASSALRHASISSGLATRTGYRLRPSARHGDDTTLGNERPHLDEW